MKNLVLPSISSLGRMGSNTYSLVRFNLKHPELYYEGVERFVAFTEDIATVIATLGRDEKKNE